MTTPPRALIVLHLGWLAVAAALIAVGTRDSLGWRVVAAIVLYDLAVLWLAHRHADRTLRRLLVFAMVLSAWMVVPDAFLAEALGSLHFPPDGLADIGPVTAHMAGLWTVPVVAIVATATYREQRSGRSAAGVVAGVTSLVIFVAAEAVLTSVVVLWEPRNVGMLGPVALYVLPAEVLLGIVAYDAFSASRARPWWHAVPVTALVMLLFLGAAAAGWLLLERVV